MKSKSAVQLESAPATTKMALHWIVAAAVMLLFASSWWMLSLPLPSDDYIYREIPFQLHKNVGLSLFLLVLVMIGLRIQHRLRGRTEARSTMQRLADIDHWILYSLLAACCISGYLSSSYSGWDTELWWILALPGWASENDGLNIIFSDIHQWSCWLLTLIIVLHVAAALFHGLRDDELLKNMFP